MAIKTAQIIYQCPGPKHSPDLHQASRLFIGLCGEAVAVVLYDTCDDPVVYTSSCVDVVRFPDYDIPKFRTRISAEIDPTKPLLKRVGRLIVKDIDGLRETLSCNHHITVLTPYSRPDIFELGRGRGRVARSGRDFAIELLTRTLKEMGYSTKETIYEGVFEARRQCYPT